LTRLASNSNSVLPRQPSYSNRAVWTALQRANSKKIGQVNEYTSSDANGATTIIVAAASYRRQPQKTQGATMTTKVKKGYKGLGMEGFIARWYARNTEQSDRFCKVADRIAGSLVDGARILEVAPGPGYLAIEIAKRGRFHVAGLDISKTFVQLATDNAAKAGVSVAFHRGDAAAMPFDADSFDRIVCMAAFKNFSDPVGALNEMCRVLKPGGKAVVIDLRPDVSNAEIDAEVKKMKLGWIGSLMTRLTFKHMLRKRAYSQEQLRSMAAQTPFSTCEIREDSIGFEVSLIK
jgi:ubiquinone/menaquinone biosynthesis C-methylase UbiE